MTGTNAFEGSTKAKRSIADRPQGVHGKLRAPRPGEYVALDTNRLDVFTMEPLTCQWVQCGLTMAMDLYARVITGLRLTPTMAISVPVIGALTKSAISWATRLTSGVSRRNAYREIHGGAELSTRPTPLTRKNSAAS
ncbi:hypothetical protein [Nonomuraea sp. NPDC052265]|uniref:hypothetical protein n=1 Tax=Nonomuraea sp. NPDC052265 TaxID=3364374 RepID=UPI0037C94E54